MAPRVHPISIIIFLVGVVLGVVGITLAIVFGVKNSSCSCTTPAPQTCPTISQGMDCNAKLFSIRTGVNSSTTNVTWTDDLSNSSSPAFKNASSIVAASLVTALQQGGPPSTQEFAQFLAATSSSVNYTVSVTQFEKGSDDMVIAYASAAVVGSSSLISTYTDAEVVSTAQNSLNSTNTNATVQPSAKSDSMQFCDAPNTDLNRTEPVPVSCSTLSPSTSSPFTTTTCPNPTPCPITNCSDVSSPQPCPEVTCPPSTNSSCPPCNTEAPVTIVPPTSFTCPPSSTKSVGTDATCPICTPCPTLSATTTAFLSSSTASLFSSSTLFPSLSTGKLTTPSPSTCPPCISPEPITCPPAPITSSTVTCPDVCSMGTTASPEPAPSIASTSPSLSTTTIIPSTLSTFTAQPSTSSSKVSVTTASTTCPPCECTTLSWTSETSTKGSPSTSGTSNSPGYTSTLPSTSIRSTPATGSSVFSTTGGTTTPGSSVSSTTGETTTPGSSVSSTTGGTTTPGSSVSSTTGGTTTPGSSVSSTIGGTTTPGSSVSSTIGGTTTPGSSVSSTTGGTTTPGSSVSSTTGGTTTPGSSVSSTIGGTTTPGSSVSSTIGGTTTPGSSVSSTVESTTYSGTIISSTSESTVGSTTSEVFSTTETVKSVPTTTPYCPGGRLAYSGNLAVVFEATYLADNEMLKQQNLMVNNFISNQLLRYGDFGQQVGLYQIGDISHVIVVPYPKNTDTYANIPTTYNGGPRDLASINSTLTTTDVLISSTDVDAQINDALEKVLDIPDTTPYSAVVIVAINDALVHEAIDTSTKLQDKGYHVFTVALNSTKDFSALASDNSSAFVLPTPTNAADATKISTAIGDYLVNQSPTCVGAITKPSTASPPSTILTTEGTTTTADMCKQQYLTQDIVYLFEDTSDKLSSSLAGNFTKILVNLAQRDLMGSQNISQFSNFSVVPYPDPEDNCNMYCTFTMTPDSVSNYINAFLILGSFTQPSPTGLNE